MIELQVARELCKRYTNLNEEDLEIIESVVQNLQLTADLTKANIFVDCLMKEGKHAVVIAEAAPTTSKSLYTEPVVGKFAYEAFEPAVFYCLRTGKNMFLNRAITQEGKVVEQSVVPIKGTHDQVIAALIMEKDISDKLKYEDELTQLTKTTQMLSEILIGVAENSPSISELMEEALFFVEPKRGELLYFNPSAINMVNEICHLHCSAGESIINYFPQIKEIVFSQDDLLMKEIVIAKKVFEVKKVNLKKGDQLSGILIIFRDITELREKERELIVKSVVIREIHHRVKNNLQTVASLLRLQMRSVPDASKSYFTDSLNRILSIASVYEIMLSSSQIDEVDIFHLIKKIGNMLVYNGENSEANISIEYEGSSLYVQSQIAISIALVVNELITNSLKHAFKDTHNGKIKILFKQEQDTVIVSVIDNGVGYSPVSKSSLGLDIVNMIVQHDLSGEFMINGTDNGTTATLKFPLNKDG